jgi:hypothetical protein
VDHECVLDGQGRARLSASARGALNRRPFHSELLRVYLFDRTCEGFYRAGSLVDATGRYVTVTRTTDGTVALEIAAPPEFAGRQAYVLTAHYYRYGDLFGPWHMDRYGEALRQYGGIAFDGTALDEFGYFYLPAPWDRTPATPPVRERFYGRAMAEFFRQHTGVEMERALFDMRYAPDGQPEVRAVAINRYFDVHRQGPLRIERFFRDRSRETFGPGIFSGVHDTAHNSLVNDEVWKTGLNWWALPRDYGQTDEDISYPVRLGVACSCPKELWYDMFYHRTDHRTFYPKAVLDARWGGRVHYLAYSAKDCGTGIEDDEFRRTVSAIEAKVRLLNHFDGPLPAMELLVVFGYPALTNWYPDAAARNTYDIRGDLEIEEKAQALWDAGYVCALAPSYAIDERRIDFADGRPVYNGRPFQAMVYLYPQYAKESTLAFLERYAAAGGKLMLEGKATRDFDGRDIRDRFARLAARATVRGFTVEGAAGLGARKNDVPDGCRLSDGSVVMTDLDSILTGRARPFEVTIDGHVLSGEFIGVLAIQAPGGRLLKLAAGGLRELRRDGETILIYPQPRDVVLLEKG